MPAMLLEDGHITDLYTLHSSSDGICAKAGMKLVKKKQPKPKNNYLLLVVPVEGPPVSGQGPCGRGHQSSTEVPITIHQGLGSTSADPCFQPL